MKIKFADRIQKPAKPYRPSSDTNIADTIKAERKRLAAAGVCKTVRMPPLVIDDPVVSNFRRVK